MVIVDKLWVFQTERCHFLSEVTAESWAAEEVRGGLVGADVTDVLAAAGAAVELTAGVVVMAARDEAAGLEGGFEAAGMAVTVSRF